MDTSIKIQIISAVDKFPIGEKSTNREELIAKASIILGLASKMREDLINNPALLEGVKKTLIEALNLTNGETLMNEIEASRILGLSNGFIQDYGKVQFIRENNNTFDNVYDLLISVAKENLDLSSRSM